MKELVAAMDKLPKLVKIILALPGLDIVWNVYRLVRSIAKKSMLGIRSEEHTSELQSPS